MNQEAYDKLLYQAKITEEAGRPQETIEYMEQIIKSKNKELTLEERNLISVAYKNCVSTRRAAWRSIYGIEVKEKANNSKYSNLVSELKQTLEAELFEWCNKMLSLIDNHLLKTTQNTENKVFYLKLKGDYYRYIAEFTAGNKHSEIAQSSLLAYTQASEIASNLPYNNPTKLGLALNYSVFYYEVLNNAQTAVNIANQAFQEGITNLDNIEEHQYKDATTILQLLKENIDMWSADTEMNENQMDREEA